MGSVTIGGNSYDVYGTNAGADAYLAARLDASSWSGAAEDTQNRALVQATRLIRPYLAGRGYDLDPAAAVDAEIENANYELAFALVVDPTIADKTSTGSNIRRTKAGSAEIEYFRPEVGSRFPSLVQTILNGWLDGQSGAAAGAGYASGTCETSTIAGDDYGLTEGF